ncbi:MAG TPA: chorismate mutase [Pseudomonas sp.]|uniref:chorismate mutase n=1 Tax=Pseudomonas sp. TaxID=306 RepID=UPI002B45EDB3|nr:chorismate mutase [Pseudomonas sp.]HKS14792.1 chorismate mutase [Pseudomonas sp.]
MRPYPFVPLLLLALQGCTSPGQPAGPLEPLLDSIERRLDIAEAVALHKWDLRQPVQATARERQVLESVRRAAPEHQLDPDRAEAFFSDQMEANKLLQYSALSSWQLQQRSPSTQRQDLHQQLRPRLDRLQAQLLEHLALLDQHPVPRCAHVLARTLAQRTDDPVRHLALVRATGQLCGKP